MKRFDLIVCGALLLGAAMAAYGLFNPLLEVPVVGAIRYAEHNLGGKDLAGAIIFLLGASAVLSPMPTAAKKVAFLFGGVALGLICASLLGIYRFTVDQIMQMGDPDALKLLHEAKVQPGLVVLVLGLLLWLGAAAATLFVGSKEPRPRD